MTDDDVQAIGRSAAWIAARRLAHRDIADMPAGLKPADEAGGYAVQAALQELQTVSAVVLHALETYWLDVHVEQLVQADAPDAE